MPIFRQTLVTKPCTQGLHSAICAIRESMPAALVSWFSKVPSPHSMSFRCTACRSGILSRPVNLISSLFLISWPPQCFHNAFVWIWTIKLTTRCLKLHWLLCWIVFKHARLAYTICSQELIINEKGVWVSGASNFSICGSCGAGTFSSLSGLQNLIWCPSKGIYKDNRLWLVFVWSILCFPTFVPNRSKLKHYLCQTVLFQKFACLLKKTQPLAAAFTINKGR